jgi:hypothetical protein
MVKQPLGRLIIKREDKLKTDYEKLVLKIRDGHA